MPTSIVLRPLALEDLPAVLAAVVESRAELEPWMTWCTSEYGETQVLEFIERCANARVHGTAYEFGVFDSGGSYLGMCGLNQINHLNRHANLGYWTRTSRTRHGYAVSAVKQLKDWAFQNTELHRLEIRASVENIGSQRVAERAGAQRDGVLRGRLWLQGRPHDEVMYCFLRGTVC